MKIVKTTEIELSGHEIIRNAVCESMDLTVSEYNDLKEYISVELDAEEKGSVDTGDYELILNKIYITIPK